MPRVSANELESTLRLAARGVGLPVGLGADLAGAAVWLCRHGLDGVGAAVAGLSGAPLSFPAAAEPVPGGLRFTAARAAVAAPSALDLLVADAAPAVTLTATDVPLLVLGVAGVCATEQGITVALASAAGEQLLTPDGGLALAPGGLETRRGADLRLSRARRAGATRPLLAGADGLQVDDSGYAALRDLAARTYVPASAESRAKGAGAGLTDTD